MYLTEDVKQLANDLQSTACCTVLKENQQGTPRASPTGSDRKLSAVSEMDRVFVDHRVDRGVELRGQKNERF